MKKNICCFLLLFWLFNGYSQTTDFINFINSFDTITDAIINVGGLESIATNRMTKNEALKYVYNGDSSNFVYTQEIITTDDETYIGTIVDSIFPYKLFRVEYDFGILIAFSSYYCDKTTKDCSDLNIFVTMVILDNNYSIKDTIIVYKGTMYMTDLGIDGLFNSKSRKIYTTDFSNTHMPHAFLYNINIQTLTFEIIKESHEYPKVGFNRQLKVLGWDDCFNDIDCQ